MPSSVVQIVLLKICEEGKEVSVGLSDFIIPGTAHKRSRAAEGWRWPSVALGGSESLWKLPVLITHVLICQGISQNHESQYIT